MRATHEARHRCVHDADHLALDCPLLAFFAEVVCTLGATPPRTATSLSRTVASLPRTATSPPANGGNCTNRGATRRRHAEGRLLMVQNPPLRLGGGGLRARGGAAARPAVCARRPSCPDMTRGNCTNRGATRRRHADRMLLMLQNPHHHPWRHAPSLVHSSLTSTMPPNELNAPDQVSSFRWAASCLRRGDARTLAR